MSEINKIPIKNLLLHISNVINACDLSSVTSYGVKEYLKHKFKDALPSEKDLDMILENVIKSVKLSQALNGDSMHFEEGNYDSFDTYEAFMENEIKDHDKPIKKRFPRKIGVCYVLKKGVDPNAEKAYSYSIKNPFTSKTIRIIKPYLNNKKESTEDCNVVHKTTISTYEENMGTNEAPKILHETDTDISRMNMESSEASKTVQGIETEISGRNMKQPSKKKMSGNPTWVIEKKGDLKIRLINLLSTRDKLKFKEKKHVRRQKRGGRKKKQIETEEKKTLPKTKDRKNVKPIEIVQKKTLPRKNVKPIEVVQKKTLPRKNVEASEAPKTVQANDTDVSWKNTVFFHGYQVSIAESAKRNKTRNCK